MQRDATDRFDVAVVGRGAVGLTAALAFAREGRRTVLVGPPGAAGDGRSVALLAGSVRLLDRLGAWDALRGEANPLAVMRLVDDSGSLFRPPPVAFSAAEIGLPEFGWSLLNAALVAGLEGVAANEPGLTTRSQAVAGQQASEDAIALTLEDGTSLAAALAVAADGRRSRLREGSGIRVRTWSYPQVALTTVLAHARDHRDVSTEFHTRHGPFTLVPLSGRRSSLVWVMPPETGEALAALDDAALARRVEEQAQSLLGAMTVDGPRGLVPMTGLSVERYTAPRLALVGEAAHVFPPIGAQGLNLGFRDVAALVGAVAEAGTDAGDPEALARYERDRAGDVRLRTGAVDALNRTLLADFLPADFLRGAGLLALDQIGPLRRFVMRQGLGARA